MASAVEHKPTNYVLIWVYLAALTGVELAVALMKFLPRNAMIVTLIVLAVWKALLVAIFFMHLKYEPKRLVYMILVPFPLAVILVMFVMRERFK